jgi:predicted transcriptional regulator
LFIAQGFLGTNVSIYHPISPFSYLDARCGWFHGNSGRALANSLHSSESHDSELVLTDLQNDQLKQLQAEIELGLEDVKEGRVLDGEAVFANLQQRISRHRETK